MNLIIDIGNTLTKVATFKDDQMVDLWAGPYTKAPEAIGALMKAQAFEAAIVSTVQHKQGEVPDALGFLQKEGIRVIMARHNMPLPITIHYDTPETLGTDRIASAVAGHRFFPDEAVLVINAGTCLTTDLVTANGEYHGGTISPGLRMRLNALHHYTGNLPLIQHSTNPFNPRGLSLRSEHRPSPETPYISTLAHHHISTLAHQHISTSAHQHTSTISFSSLPGQSTHDSIHLGVSLGVIAEIDGLIEAYQKKISFFNVILSGGDINFFDKRLKNRIFAVENIVLHGLNQMLIHNA